MLWQCCYHQLIRLNSSIIEGMLERRNDRGIMDCIWKVTLKEQLPCYNQQTQFASKCEFYKNRVSRKANNQDGSVGIVARLPAGRPRNCNSIPGTDKRFFSSLKSLQGLRCPPSLLFSGSTWLFIVQLSGRANGDKPLSSAQVENEWSCTSTPLCLYGN